MKKAAPKWEINVFHAFHLAHRGAAAAVAQRQQRLIALLAIEGPTTRSLCAAQLWPNSTEARAMASLRAGLYQIAHEFPGLLECSAGEIRLREDASVDIWLFRELLLQVWAEQSIPVAAMPETVAVLESADLLPGWYDDWVLVAQRRLDEDRLDALERLADRSLRLADARGALRAASAAISIEPLRESAHLIAMRAFIAAGNPALAVAHYERLRRRLFTQFGSLPAPQLTQLAQMAHHPSEYQAARPLEVA